MNCDSSQKMSNNLNEKETELLSQKMQNLSLVEKTNTELEMDAVLKKKKNREKLLVRIYEHLEKGEEIFNFSFNHGEKKEFYENLIFYGLQISQSHFYQILREELKNPNLCDSIKKYQLYFKKHFSYYIIEIKNETDDKIRSEVNILKELCLYETGEKLKYIILEAEDKTIKSFKEKNTDLVIVKFDGNDEMHQILKKIRLVYFHNGKRNTYIYDIYKKAVSNSILGKIIISEKYLYGDKTLGIKPNQFISDFWKQVKVSPTAQN